MARMTARFSRGRCAGCRERVHAGDVIDFDRTTREMLCATCAPPPDPTAAPAHAAPPRPPAVVRVTLDGGQVAFQKAGGRLSNEAFAAYRAALAGGRFAAGVNTLPLDRAGEAILALVAAHFALDVAPDAKARISARAGDAIDWAAIDAAAADARGKAEESARTAAAEHARRRAEAQAAAKARKVRRSVRATAARRLNEPEADENAPVRGPATVLERWAIEGLRQLAALDPDRAREKNEVGYSASDGRLGHHLASFGELTDQEWRLAVQIARHYPGQIGTPPDDRADEPGAPRKPRARGAPPLATSVLHAPEPPVWLVLHEEQPRVDRRDRSLSRLARRLYQALQRQAERQAGARWERPFLLDLAAAAEQLGERRGDLIHALAILNMGQLATLAEAPTHRSTPSAPSAAEASEAGPVSLPGSMRTVEPSPSGSQSAVIPADAAPDPPFTTIVTHTGPRTQPILARYGDLAVHRAHDAAESAAGELVVTHEGTGIGIGAFSPTRPSPVLDPATLLEALAFAWDVNHRPAVRAALDALVRAMPPFPTKRAFDAAVAEHRAVVDAWKDELRRSEARRLERYRARARVAPVVVKAPARVLLSKRRKRVAGLGEAGALLGAIEQQAILEVGGQWETPFDLELDEIAQRIGIERGEGVALLRVLLARGLVRSADASAQDTAPASGRRLRGVAPAMPRAQSPFASAARARAPRASATDAADEASFAYLPVVSGYIAWPDVGTRVLWTEETSVRRGKLTRHRTVTYSGRVTRVDVDADNPKGTRVWAAPDGGAEREVGIGGLRVPKADIARFAAKLAPLAAYIHEHGRLPPARRTASPFAAVAAALGGGR